MTDNKYNPVDFHFAALPGEGEAAWRVHFERVLEALVHRMNNHATVAQGFSSLLLTRATLDATARENLRRIQEAAAGLSALAHHVGAVAGCTSPEVRELCPVGILAEIAATAGEWANACACGMTAALPAVLPRVRAEAGGLREILLAMLAHAVGRASVAAEPAVRVEARATTDNRWVDVLVTDNGPPIAPDAMAGVFELFPAALPGTVHPGLAAAAMSAHLLGGGLGVRSGETGSTRWLRLPAAGADGEG